MTGIALSTRTPKAWLRRRVELGGGYGERLHAALESVLGELPMVDAAFWHDSKGELRRIDALYTNGVIVSYRTAGDVAEVVETMPKFTFSTRIGGRLAETRA